MVTSMGRSGAEYIPDEIRDQAMALGYSGVNTYTEALGLNERRLYRFFSANHKKLRPYYNLAIFCGITLDELLKIIESDKLTEHIERIKTERNIDSIMAFERMAEVGPGFIRSLLRGKISATSFNNWNEVAVSLDWTLHKLAKTALKQ
jgi:hypothetical protein